MIDGGYMQTTLFPRNIYFYLFSRFHPPSLFIFSLYTVHLSIVPMDIASIPWPVHAAVFYKLFDLLPPPPRPPLCLCYAATVLRADLPIAWNTKSGRTNGESTRERLDTVVTRVNRWNLKFRRYIRIFKMQTSLRNNTIGNWRESTATAEIRSMYQKRRP